MPVCWPQYFHENKGFWGLTWKFWANQDSTSPNNLLFRALQPELDGAEPGNYFSYYRWISEHQAVVRQMLASFLWENIAGGSECCTHYDSIKLGLHNRENFPTQFSNEQLEKHSLKNKRSNSHIVCVQLFIYIYECLLIRERRGGMNPGLTIHCFRNSELNEKKKPGNSKPRFPVDSTSVTCILIGFLFPMTARISIYEDSL